MRSTGPPGTGDRAGDRTGAQEHIISLDWTSLPRGSEVRRLHDRDLPDPHGEQGTDSHYRPPVQTGGSGPPGAAGPQLSDARPTTTLSLPRLPNRPPMMWSWVI